MLIPTLVPGRAHARPNRNRHRFPGWSHHPTFDIGLLTADLELYFKHTYPQIYPTHLSPLPHKMWLSKYLLVLSPPLAKLQRQSRHSDLSATLLLAEPREDSTWYNEEIRVHVQSLAAPIPEPTPRRPYERPSYGKYKDSQIDFDLHGTWEALDRSVWINFDAQELLDTIANQSEHLCSNCVSTYSAIPFH